MKYWTVACKTFWHAADIPNDNLFKIIEEKNRNIHVCTYHPKMKRRTKKKKNSSKFTHTPERGIVWNSIEWEGNRLGLCSFCHITSFANKMPTCVHSFSIVSTFVYWLLFMISIKIPALTVSISNFPKKKKKNGFGVIFCVFFCFVPSPRRAFLCLLCRNQLILLFSICLFRSQVFIGFNACLYILNTKHMYEQYDIHTKHLKAADGGGQHIKQIYCFDSFYAFFFLWFYLLPNEKFPE